MRGLPRLNDLKQVSELRPLICGSWILLYNGAAASVVEKSGNLSSCGLEGGATYKLTLVSVCE